MIDQEKIFQQCFSDNPKEYIEGFRQLMANFSLLTDKQKAWEDLIRLISDEDDWVKVKAASVLSSAFPHVPDKQQAWNDLFRLTKDEDHNLDYDVRERVTEALSSAFPQVTDKQHALDDLHRLTNGNYWYVRYSAAVSLVSSFSHVSDKQQAWNDLHRLTKDEDRVVRSKATEAFGSVFSQAPDKQEAWDDLHRLTKDEDRVVRSNAASALGSVFSQVTEKQEAWDDLHRLTNDKDNDVRFNAASALGSAFSQVTDKQQAWDDLHRLTKDKSSRVRFSAALALGSAFTHVPDKQQAWNDLHRLINDEDRVVKRETVEALGSAFSHVPDKQQAWNDLHKLTNDEDILVRTNAASALGSVFSQVTEKQEVWDELHRLIEDEVSSVRSSSIHSLGRVSIFMASQAKTDEDFKKELEKAIDFFEIAAKESHYFNPARFCLPFYRSFYTIIFKKLEAKEEVDKYLEEAKSAIEGSESKKQLFEAVENLSNALKEVQNMGNLDLSGIKDELNFYRKYCDHAAELMKCTDEKAPFATEVMRKGLPILDRNLKGLIEEIQEKAKIACKESIGTATEEIACAVNQEVQKWEIGNQEEMTFCAKNLARSLKLIIPPISDNEFILNEIDKALNEKDLINIFTITSIFIGSIPALKMVSDKLNNLEKSVIEVNSKVDELIIISKPSITQEIEISSGIEILGTGAALITTIPLQEISYAELKEDLKKIKGKNITKLSKLPERLARKIKGYLLLNDREDIIEQLT